MRKQCQDIDCREWYETEAQKQRFCPACLKRHRSRVRRRHNAAVRSTCSGRSTSKGFGRTGKVRARLDSVPEHIRFVRRSEAHTASDIMHAPADKAAAMIDRILSGRDILVGVG